MKHTVSFLRIAKLGREKAEDFYRIENKDYGRAEKKLCNWRGVTEPTRLGWGGNRK